MGSGSAISFPYPIRWKRVCSHLGSMVRKPETVKGILGSALGRIENKIIRNRQTPQLVISSTARAVPFCLPPNLQRKSLPQHMMRTPGKISSPRCKHHAQAQIGIPRQHANGKLSPHATRAPPPPPLSFYVPSINPRYR